MLESNRMFDFCFFILVLYHCSFLEKYMSLFGQTIFCLIKIWSVKNNLNQKMLSVSFIVIVFEPCPSQNRNILSSTSIYAWIFQNIFCGNLRLANIFCELGSQVQEVYPPLMGAGLHKIIFGCKSTINWLQDHKHIFWSKTMHIATTKKQQKIYFNLKEFNWIWYYPGWPTSYITK